jgi:phytoene dehydrogenase-like protein
MYDLIVIGDDLSSHIAAAAAAHYGLHTALLAESGVGGFFLEGDFAFNIDPTPITGFGANETCLALLAELDIPPIERESTILNPAYQIILPDHRIDFFNNKENLINELVREFPDYEQEITDYYEAVEEFSTIFSQWFHKHPFIQPRSFKEYYEYLKLIPQILRYKIDVFKLKSAFIDNESLHTIMEAQWALLSSLTDTSEPFSANLLYSAPLRGVYYFQQGKQILFNSLIQKLEKANGLYFNNCKVEAVNTKEIINVEIVDKDGDISKISAKQLIVSTKWRGMPLIQANEKSRFNIADWFRPIKVTHYPFALHIGCEQKCLPEKMARYSAIVSDIDKDLLEDNLIILESSMPEDEKFAASAKISLTATVYLPNDPAIWQQENLTAAAASILDRLELFLPFLKDNITFYDLDKSIGISLKSREVVNSKYKIRKSLLTGFFAKDNKTNYENVFLTGGALLPDAGFEGEIMSGMNAVSRVMGKRGKQ